MNEILGTFGIDWRLLLVNGANFALALLVLWYFLYAPLQRMLEERRQKVAQGVADALAAREALEGIEKSRAQKLAAAGKEADALLARARETAGNKQRELTAAAEAAAAGAIKEAHEQAQELKARAIEESKREVAALIVLGMENMHKAQ